MRVGGRAAATLLMVIVLLLPIAPTARAEDERRVGVPVSSAAAMLGAAIYEAAEMYPDTFTQATLLSSTRIRIVLKETSRHADKFRRYVSSRQPVSLAVEWGTEFFAQDDLSRLAAEARLRLEASGLEFAGGRLDPEARTFYAFVADSSGARRAAQLGSVEVEKVKVQLSVAEGSAEAESRYSDYGQLKGGMALNVLGRPPQISDATCTGGFNWKKWGTGEQLGSTAAHCWKIDYPRFYTRFYNFTNFVGSRAYFDPKGVIDVMLLRRAGNFTYGPTVWWGTTDTANYLTVERATIPYVGQRVSMSGANSGTVTAVVVDAYGTLPSGQPVTRVDRLVSKGGDSGAPWGYVVNGKVTAVGIHTGRVCFAPKVNGQCPAGQEYSVFSPLNPVSKALGASILTG